MFDIESDAYQHTFCLNNVTGLPIKRPAVDPSTIPVALHTAVRQYKHDTLYSDGSIHTDTVVAYDMETTNLIFRQLLDSIPDQSPPIEDEIVFNFEDIFPKGFSVLTDNVKPTFKSKFTRWFRRNV